MDLTRIGPSHGVFVGSCAWITQKKRQSGAHNIFSTSCIHNNCMGCTLVLFGAHSPLNGGPIINIFYGALLSNYYVICS